MEVAIVGYSHGGLILGEWLAESLRQHHANAGCVLSIAQRSDEATARDAALLFESSNLIIAIINSDSSNAVMFDFGVARFLGKTFVLLAPDETSLEAFPAPLRKTAQIMALTPDETAVRILGALQAA